jgi:Xaa-Pro dipeptidase
MLTLDRRSLLGGAVVAPVAFGLSLPSFAATPGLPPAIGRGERLARLAKARGLMRREGIGAFIIEPGASLD